jgi:methyl-accepting chemotaxis protein
MRISITGKFCFILLIIFSAVLISTTLYQTYRERQLVFQLGQEHVKTLVQNYANGLDLFVASEHPENFRDYETKLLKQNSIFSLKLVTGNSALFSAASTHITPPTTPEEHEVLQGSIHAATITRDGHAWIEYMQPYYLPGQNLNNSPTAAIGMEYSLDKQLDMVEKHIMLSAMMLSAIFCGILLLTLSITRKHMVLPLVTLRQSIDDVTDFNDLSIRLPVSSNDEIAQLNDSFNQLMERLSAKAAENKKLASQIPGQS